MNPSQAGAAPAPPSSASFAEVAYELIDTAVRANRDGIQAAAEVLFDSLREGGVIQTFGTGHSLASALELAGRAGGLIPTNRISLSDLVLFGGDDPRTLDDPLLERASGLAERLYGLAAPSDRDVFVIFSNSGVNASIVDMAITVKRHGLPLVAVTSVIGSQAVPARHDSGTRLLDHADVVLDNSAPRGDTLLDTGAGPKVCAISSITTAFLVQMLVAEVSRRYVEAELEVPAYVSSNVPGGHERNVELERRYAGRIRRGAV